MSTPTNYRLMYSDWDSLTSRQKFNRVARRQLMARRRAHIKEKKRPELKMKTRDLERAEVAKLGMVGSEEAARMTGLSPNTIANWIKKGFLSSRKMGSFRFVSIAEVTEYAAKAKEADRERKRLHMEKLNQKRREK